MYRKLLKSYDRFELNSSRLRHMPLLPHARNVEMQPRSLFGAPLPGELEKASLCYSF